MPAAAAMLGVFGAGSGIASALGGVALGVLLIKADAIERDLFSRGVVTERYKKPGPVYTGLALPCRLEILVAPRPVPQGDRIANVLSVLGSTTVGIGH